MIKYMMMTITNEKLHRQIDEFPDEFSIGEVIERLIMIEKLETGMKESEKEETVSEEDLKDKMKQWFR